MVHGYKKIRTSDLQDKSYRNAILRNGFLSSPSSNILKIQICGPEGLVGDNEGPKGLVEDSNDTGVKDTGRAGGILHRLKLSKKNQELHDKHVEKVFKAISVAPSLRALWIEPSFDSSESGHMISLSRLCWLVSESRRLETLVVQNLVVMTQKDVDQLAALLLTCCKSLKHLAIDQLIIGHQGVQSLLPLARSIAKLPNLTHLCLVLDAFNQEETTDFHAKEILPVLQTASLPNVGLKVYPEREHELLRFMHLGHRLLYRELSNCQYNTFHDICYKNQVETRDERDEVVVDDDLICLVG